jgi:hypothetical protein
MGDFSIGFSSKFIQSTDKFLVFFLRISELGLYLCDLLFINIDLLGSFNLEFLDHLNLSLFSYSSYVLILIL